MSRPGRVSFLSPFRVQDGRRCCANLAPRGMVHLDILVSIGLTVALVAIFAAALVQYASVRRQTDLRRELRLAASTELDRIRAGLRPLTSGDREPTATSQPDDIGAAASAPSSAPSDTTIRVIAQPATGEWAGFTYVRVLARRRAQADHWIEVEVAGYVALDQAAEAQPLRSAETRP